VPPSRLGSTLSERGFFRATPEPGNSNICRRSAPQYVF